MELFDHTADLFLLIRVNFDPILWRLEDLAPRITNWGLADPLWAHEGFLESMIFQRFCQIIF